jgi:hypothetical protein
MIAQQTRTWNIWLYYFVAHAKRLAHDTEAAVKIEGSLVQIQTGYIQVPRISNIHMRTAPVTHLSGLQYCFLECDAL